MKFFNWLVNRYLLAGLMLASIACIISLAISLAYALFNFNPYYEHKGKDASTWSIGTDYQNGIPVTIDVNSSNIADTSIAYVTSKGNKGIFSTTGNNRMELPTNDSIKTIDTMNGNYALHYWFDTTNKHEQKATNLSIPSFKVYVKPTSVWHWIELLTPSIFILIVLAYSFWQMAKFLQFIQLKDAFNYDNYKRLRNIGIALLLYQFVMLIFDFAFHHYNISMQFESTIPNWRSPFYLSGSPQANSSLSYFIIGCIFLIIAKAFNEGNRIKHEQDLTI